VDARLPVPGIADQIALEELRLARDERTAARDEQFAALVGRHARFVFRVTYSILRNVQDAEDAVQDTFLKLYRSPADWEHIADEKAFLARTAWRVAVDQLRHRKAPKNAPACDAAWPGQNPEQAAMISDWNSCVHRLIDTLPEELRQPLALSSVEELNSRQIAEMMGVPEGTVRTRLMRARQILKQKLNALRAGHNER
jgi:RNA polymerase sigma-70 factor (ECF subfamily)